VGETIAIRVSDYKPTNFKPCAKCGAEVCMWGGMPLIYLVPRWRPICEPCAIEIEPDTVALYRLFWAAFGFQLEQSEERREELLKAASTRGKFLKNEQAYTERRARFQVLDGGKR
jgi:hypothetical protein